MDQNTHEVRTTYWQSIISQCLARPDGQSAKRWLQDNEVNEKQYYYWQRKLRNQTYQLSKEMNQTQLPVKQSNQTYAFAEIPVASLLTESEDDAKPDAVIRTPHLTIELSNSISDTLLTRILEVVSIA